MAKRLQHRGGTTAQHSTFTGAVREVTVDTDKNTLVVHDGATAGGHPLATATNFTSTGIDDNATSTAITIDSLERVGIGTSNPQAKLNINASSEASVPALGNDTSFLMVGNDGSGTTNYGTMFGTVSTGNGYIQQQRFDGTATSYNLLLQPNGGKVGIGTTSPSTLLHIASSLPIITLGDTDVSTLATISGNSGYLNLDAHTGQTVRFSVGASEKARIDSSGRLLVGTTNTSAIAQSGNSMTYDNGRLEVQKYRTPALRVGNYTDAFGAYSGNLVEFYSGGTTVGSIGVTSLRTFVGTGDTGLLFNDVYDSIDPWDTSTNSARDNNIDLGDATRRYKDLYLGGGLYVGGTGTANKLDDYEEGTWTPSYEGSTTNPVVTYGERHGAYNKIGNMVTCFVRISASFDTAGSGNLRLTGLPFTPVAFNGNIQSGSGVISQSKDWSAPEGCPSAIFIQTTGVELNRLPTGAQASDEYEILTANFTGGDTADNKFSAVFTYRTT